MNQTLHDYVPWIGLWSGIGETQDGRACFIRTTFEEGLEANGLRMHFEAWDPALTTLFHGVRAMLTAAPSGVMRALAHSTIHGPLILELTPDDEGVMALAGESVAQHYISVTFVEESPDQLLFTAFWRPTKAPPGISDGPNMSCTLSRASVT